MNKFASDLVVSDQYRLFGTLYTVEAVHTEAGQTVIVAKIDDGEGPIPRTRYVTPALTSYRMV